ncbi:MAG: ABC-F family ATP-binding cassette domain-containing protein, partial [Deltaproteobacteria bacterium]|nr:ABC-F family ATP-binding cassette domain-containing protein [Deltaproteobacteria bacterium]
MPILVAENLRKAYGELTLLDGVDVSIHEGERVGLVGSNGAGKSTLARMLVGIDTPDEGRVARRREATIRYLSQEPDLPMERTARDVVFDGLGAWADAFRTHEALSHRIAAHEPGWEELLGKQAASAQEVERLGGWERSRQVDVLLEQLGMRQMLRPIEELSGGEQRRVALARLLVEEPTLAVLDEPTNHLDADTIEWLETYLKEQYRGALLLITHDRYVLDRVVTRTLEIDQGQIHSYAGGWQSYLTAKAERMAHASRAEANRKNLLRTELDWLRRSPKARTSKSKARVERAVALRDAKGPQVERVARFELQRERLGGTVLETHDLSLELGGRELVRSLSFVLQRGERVGIVGPNGAGKTTLLKAVLGLLEPSLGRVVVGKNTKFAYFDQGRSGPFQGANAHAPRWQRCSSFPRTCCCSTNPPTTSTFRHSLRWRRCSSKVSPPHSSFVTTGTFSTAWQPGFWRSRTRARSQPTRATTATIAKRGLSATPRANGPAQWPARQRSAA